MASKRTPRPHSIILPSKVSFILFVVAVFGYVIGSSLHEFGVLTVGEYVLNNGFNAFDIGLNPSALSRNVAASRFDRDLLWPGATRSHPTPQPASAFNNIDNGLCESGVLGYVYDVSWDGIRFDCDVNHTFERYFNANNCFNGTSNPFHNASSGMCIFLFFEKVFSCAVAT